MFLHDVPRRVAAEAGAPRRAAGGHADGEPWPLERWPDVPTRFLLCRDDRFFPADFQRRVVRERLGHRARRDDGGHCVALGRPDELVALLERLRAAAGA